MVTAINIVLHAWNPRSYGELINSLNFVNYQQDLPGYNLISYNNKGTYNVLMNPIMSRPANFALACHKEELFYPLNIPLFTNELDPFV